jgi:hypothetical protein
MRKGQKATEEQRKKMREAWKHRAPLSEEWRKNHSERMKGKGNPMYGKPRPEEMSSLKGEV